MRTLAVRILESLITSLLAASVVTQSAPASLAAPVQWSSASGGNDHWYEAISSTGTWSAADAAARKLGGYLATISSEEENNFVFSLVDSPEFWSIDTADNNEGPWIGGYYAGPSDTMDTLNWKWVTGEPWVYANWDDGEPNFTYEHCTNFFSNDASSSNPIRQPFWNNVSCIYTARGFVVEFDTIPVACANVAKPNLTIGKLNTPPGDDKLAFTGQLTLPSPFNPALDPLANGVRLLIEDTAGTPLDVSIPGGTGWRVNKSGTKWTYRNKTPVGTAGIYKVVIQDKSAVSPGLVKFAVNGKAGSYAVASTNLPVTARLILAPSSGQCADTSFSSCAFNRSGSTLKCK